MFRQSYHTMHFIFADDSIQRRPTRPGMGVLIAIGGFCIKGEKIKNLSSKIDEICSKYGFPPGEIFKWSPGRELWMWDSLKGEKRSNFFREVLDSARKEEIKGIVIVEDRNKRPATERAPNAEIDVIRLFIERIDWELFRAEDQGIIIVDRPSGDRAAEDKFLLSCLESLQAGTEYVGNKRFALNVLSTPSKLTRLLQLADLIVSCSLAAVGGEDQYSPPFFDKIREILCKESGRIGGVGLKIHPDFSYVNLYHWLLKDSYYLRRNIKLPLPIDGFPYSLGALIPKKQ